MFFINYSSFFWMELLVEALGNEPLGWLLSLLSCRAHGWDSMAWAFGCGPLGEALNGFPSFNTEKSNLIFLEWNDLQDVYPSFWIPPFLRALERTFRVSFLLFLFLFSSLLLFFFFFSSFWCIIEEPIKFLKGSLYVFSLHIIRVIWIELSVSGISICSNFHVVIFGSIILAINWNLFLDYYITQVLLS